jgi:phosphatidylglycerophosphate synthase
VYNAALCDSLSRADVVCERMSVDEALEALSAGSSDCFWVDTLYLDALPRLASANVANASLRLAVHYLPSMVPSGETSPALQQSERVALETATAFLVTSPYMAEVLRGLGVRAERICVVEPGVAVDHNPDERRDRASGFHATIVANLQPAKGIRELLDTLGARLPREVPFTLSVVGSLEMDAEYARSCRALVDSLASLAGRVDFLGSVSHDGVLAEMRRSDVVVSASEIESYGMALAEARAVGIPIVALRGGALFDDIDALVTDLIRLASDPMELDRRTELALARRRIRTWDQAALDFEKAIVALDAEPRSLKPVAQPRKPPLWETWTMAHSIWMLALIGLSWAVHAAWISAVGGAASLLVLVALGREQWGEGGVIGWANLITLGRLATIVAIASSSRASPIEALGAAGVMCLDWLDGRVARRRREATEFGAKFDMETDALFIAAVGAKLAVVGRLAAWIFVPGLLRYIYALAVGLVETRGEAPRSRFGRYVFAIQGASLAVALWPIQSVFVPLAVVATLLTTYSFARSAYWSLGVARVHSNHRTATG